MDASSLLFRFSKSLYVAVESKRFVRVSTCADKDVTDAANGYISSTSLRDGEVHVLVDQSSFETANVGNVIYIYQQKRKTLRITLKFLSVSLYCLSS